MRLRPHQDTIAQDGRSSAASGTTRVMLTWIENRIEHWIRFGHWVDEDRLDRRTRIVAFAPGSVFAFVRWESNDYGTIVSRIDIMRAVGAGVSLQTAPGVDPGGQLLLKLRGWPTVERVLQAIDQIEATGIDPADICTDHWRHVHNRLISGQSPRPYTKARHKAFLLRRKAMP